MEETSIMFILGALSSAICIVAIIAIVTRVQFREHMHYLHNERVDDIE